MRIALAVTEFPSASQTFVMDHACALIGQGHDVQLHALKVGSLRKTHASIEKFRLLHRSRYAPAQSQKSRPVRNFLWLLHRGWRDLLLHPVLTAKFLRNGGGYRVERLRRCLSLWADGPHYDLIHAHSGYNGERLLPLYEAGHLRAPLVVTFHGHDVFGYLQARLPTHYQALFARAAALIVCSDFMRKRLLELGAPPHKLQVIPNPVQADQIPYRIPGSALNRCLQLLTIGRLVPFKGLRYLIEALAQPALSGLHFQLHVVGEGPLREALTRQVLECGLSNKVVFHGACSHEQVLLLISHSDLYIAPVIIDVAGNTETQGVALLEAMASGLPVIASAVGAIPETLGNCAAALVPPGDSAALAKAIEIWAANLTAHQVVSRNSRLRVENVYAPALWLKSLEALYDQVTAREIA